MICTGHKKYFVIIMQKVKPYTKLAQIYNRLMNHVDYERWGDYIKSLFKYADINIKYILDLSCGTGNLLDLMIDDKLLCFGCDLSQPMLVQSQHSETCFKFPLFVNDARAIAIHDQSFDVVLFLYDSINYLLKKSDLLKLINEIYRILHFGGLLIFDTVSDEHCKVHFNHSHENEFWGNEGYFRYNSYNEKTRIQTTQFEIKLGDDIYLEIHKQRIYSVKDLIYILSRNKFQISGIFHNFTHKKMKSDAHRIHFVCKKSLI